MEKTNFLIVTGMSGAGKTLAIQSLEDLGFFCIDNLPPVLIPKFAELVKENSGKMKKIAVVTDLRGRDFFSTLISSLVQLEAYHFLQYKILFLEASDPVLVQRFKETRRRHPLAEGGSPLEGITLEREMLSEIKGKANYIIDTSNLKANELKEKIKLLFSDLNEQGLPVQIISFGFKHGIPIDADLVFDVRFLPNPHYIAELRPHTGLDDDVYQYVMKWPETNEFLHKLSDLLTFLLPNYYREGKNVLVIAIGCTGGKHRSVAIAEYLANFLRKSYKVQVQHRDAFKEK